MRVSFTVNGEPQSKARARTRRGGPHYTPEATRVAQEHVRWAARSVLAGHVADKAPYRLRLKFYCGKRNGRDGDNLEKLVMDALQGVVWVNDSQVIDCHWIILAAETTPPRTEIEIERITN